MLYKKYHRIYVSQFKKGTRFKYGRRTGIVTKPCYYIMSRDAVYIKDSEFEWVVVYPGGKVNKYLHVIQKIS